MMKYCAAAYLIASQECAGSDATPWRQLPHIRNFRHDCLSADATAFIKTNPSRNRPINVNAFAALRNNASVAAMPHTIFR